MGGKIDLFDKKLLYELDKDASQSLSVLAKTIKRSKQFVLYRMNRLEEEGVIQGYSAIIDMSKLGYFTFRVYLKLQQLTVTEKNALIKHINTKHDQVWSITSMHGKWDLALFLGVKKISEFHTIWESMMGKFKQKISTYNVTVYAPIYNFNRTFFLDKKAQTNVRVYGEGSAEKIGEVDHRIIEAYAKNIRQPVTQLAEELNLSPTSVRKRIKDLEKKKIICGYKVKINLHALGYVGYRVDIELVSTHRNKELFEYCREHPYIYQVNKSIGGADFETEMIVHDLNHLLTIIDEIKTRFSDAVSYVDYMGYSTIHTLRFIPD